jgi:hypothetical protein
MKNSVQRDRRMTWLMKVFVPLLQFLGSAALVLSGRPTFPILKSRLLVASPFLLLAIFLLGLAEVRVSGKDVEYLRFFKWERIPCQMLRSYGESWFPGIAFLKADFFVPPWGKVYFVTLRPLLAPRNSDLLSQIRKLCSGSNSQIASLREHSAAAPQLCVIMALMGFSVCLFAVVFSPGIFSQPNMSSLPRWIVVAADLWGRLTRWPWVLIPGAFLLMEILRSRYKNRAWLASLILGSLLGFATGQLLW